MQGFDAITAQNGWAMAATGAAIVITGLSLLSFIISQLHRILGLFETKKQTAEPEVKESLVAPVPQIESGSIDPLADLADTATRLKPITAQLGESFGLAQLYQAMEAAQAPHPHITVRELKAAGYLEPVAEGTFSWKNV